ncbi:MAG: hypothetical protein NXI20_04285 [bacterium]|nr:hypothetical protein [bacterium]
MKTQINKIAFILAAMVLFSSASVFASGNENKKNDSTSVEITFNEEVMTDVELDEILLVLEDETSNWLNETITYNIFDTQDNLIHTSTVNRSEPLNDAQLVKLLAQSRSVNGL